MRIGAEKKSLPWECLLLLITVLVYFDLFSNVNITVAFFSLQLITIPQYTTLHSQFFKQRTYVFKDFILFPKKIQNWIICQSSEKNVPFQKQYFPLKKSRQWTQIDHYGTHSLLSNEISELNDMTKIDTKNKDIGNYMTVMKCIWGNLDLSNQIIDEKNVKCVFKPEMRDKEWEKLDTIIG